MEICSSYFFVVIVSLISFCYSAKSKSGTTTEAIKTTTVSLSARELVDAIMDDNSTENPITEEPSSPSPKPKSSLISRNPNDIEFYLYNDREDLMSNKKIILNDSLSLVDSGYNPLRPLIIIIHGYGENYSSEFPQSTKDEYLNANTKSNIIVVDWGKLSTPAGGAYNIMIYPFAAANVINVGKRVTELLRFLMSSSILDGPEKVHMVGYDLGAHVAGVAGNRILLNSSSGENVPASVKPVARITGLDPSSPHMLASRENKLDTTDASFVDIIHTNQGGMGYIGAVGHADFYVNGGGPFQPGCPQLIDSKGMCAHRKAYLYFIKSITDYGDPALKGCRCLTYIDSICKKLCKESAIMGEHCSPSVRGNYFLDYKTDDTNSNSNMQAQAAMMSMLAKST